MLKEKRFKIDIDIFDYHFYYFIGAPQQFGKYRSQILKVKNDITGTEGRGCHSVNPNNEQRKCCIWCSNLTTKKIAKEILIHETVHAIQRMLWYMGIEQGYVENTELVANIYEYVITKVLYNI